MLRLFFICSAVLLTGISAQNMTQTAVKRYFKYTDATGLKNITTRLNNAKDGPLCKKKCSNLANSKQFIGSGVTVNSSDPFSKPAKVIPACQKFCAHRFAFRKLVNYLKDLLIAKQRSKLATKLKAIFFRIDKENNNSFMTTLSLALNEMMADEKAFILMETIEYGLKSFGMKFPNAVLNLFEFVEPGSEDGSTIVRSSVVAK